ncbi:unnamed protein product [Paramecium sonneborni]|uniref:ABC transporter ATP-binding protein n=1 Tax=Paramecium sonneborni TaxID=65129 RepID=A0A8S1JWD9_9CILI|nr:unnamed protein product [Paramecium sonneborni]
MNTINKAQLLDVDNQIQFNQKNCGNIFFFAWIYRLLAIGNKKPLVQSDLAIIDQDCNMETSYSKFSSIKQKLLWVNLLYSFKGISIAHKVTTIMNSDRIMVLNDGKITEFDHPQKLLADPNSEFKKIIDLIKHSEIV